jgi:predicted RNA-binding protein YlqC (UPF0109 family)
MSDDGREVEADFEDDDDFDEVDAAIDAAEAKAEESTRAKAVGGVKAKAVAEYIARSLVEFPDAIEVDLEERRGEVQVLLHCDPSDMGRMIGKRGRVIQALRQVTRAAGAAEGVKTSVDVVE